MGKALVPVVLIVLAACRRPPAEPPPPLAVDVVRLARGEATSSYQATGDIHAAVESALSFRVSGKLVERKVDVGDAVKAGALLATLDPQQQNADVAVASATMRSAKAALDHAEVEVGRDRTLFAHGAIPKAALDRSEREYDEARSALSAANASLGMAGDARSFTELRAAHDGVITTRNADSGQVVQAGQPIYGLADSGARDAVFEIDEASAARANTSMTIELSLVDAPEVKAEGKVREIAPIVDAEKGSVRVKVRIESAPKEMPLGAPVVGRLTLRASDTFTVPPSAIAVDEAGHPAVLVVDPGTHAVALRPVSVVRYESRAIVVREGLQDGEIVVARGVNLLRPGQVVRVNEGSRS